MSEGKAREFKFKIKRRADGEAWVIWEGDPIRDSEPGSFHVIEYSAYAKLRAALERIANEGGWTVSGTRILAQDALKGSGEGGGE